MPVAPLSCSKPTGTRPVGAKLLQGSLCAGLALILAGCNASSSGFGSAGAWRGLTAGLSSKASDQKPVKKETGLAGQVKTADNSGKKPDVVKKGPLTRAATTRSTYSAPLNFEPDSSLGRSSARCRELLALTGIETKLLRSPTLSTEGDDNGDVSVSVGYDVVDLRRARLKEELAVAKCERHLSSKRLQALLITSPQALSRAGYLAKANSLRSSSGSFRAIRGQIQSELINGNLTYQRANLLNQHLDQVVTRESKARGDAARREAVDRVQLQSARGLDHRLVETERRIHAINRDMRTADAVELRFSGGYGVEESSTSVVRKTNGEAFAKAKLSIRLGAFDPRRDELEDIAGQARIDGLYEEQSGAFWRAGEIVNANRRALDALRKQRGEIISAMTKARQTAAIRSTDYETELTMPRLRARVDILALKAELAGVDATIADTKRIGKTLSFQ